MTDIMTRASPPDWQLYRLGQLFRERKEKGSDKEFPPLSVTMGGIVPQLETAAKTDDGDNRKIVRVGDYVINSRSDRKGSGGISDYEGSVSLISIVLEPRDDIESRYAHHLLRSPAFQEEFYRWGHGIVADLWTTRYADMKNIRLCVPDLATQRQIADFLDRETARIDLLIEKKQRLVALLGEKFKEEKRSLFYGDHERHDLNLRFPFLRRLKSEWRVSKNARHFKIRMGETILSEAVSDTGFYPVYSATEQDVFFGYVEQTTAPLKRGDLVVPARGNSIGHVKFVSSPSTSTQTTIQLSCVDPEILSEFAYCWMKSFKQYLFPFDRTAIPQITTEQVGRNPLPIADIQQQNDVCAAFKRLEEREDRLSAPIKASIDRVKEYRSALITAAVTGQIDVSTYAKAGTTDRRLDSIQEEMGA